MSIKILTLSFYISCYPFIIIAKSLQQVEPTCQSWPNSTLNLNFLHKRKKEKSTYNIFALHIFINVNNSFDHIFVTQFSRIKRDNSRTCYQTHFGTELKLILLSLSFLLEYGKLLENCESKFSRRANKGNATNFARACKYKRYNV